jgi:hypothetical protein
MGLVDNQAGRLAPTAGAGGAHGVHRHAVVHPGGHVGKGATGRRGLQRLHRRAGRGGRQGPGIGGRAEDRIDGVRRQLSVVS